MQQPWDTLLERRKTDDVGWLLSYMDMLTLLLSLFVILLTFSTFDKPAFEQTKEKLKEEFTQPILPENLDPTLQLSEDLKAFVNLTWVKGQANLEIKDNLLFETASSELTDSGHELVKKLIPLLQDHKGTIEIEGHTDNVPISNELHASNWELSAGRASSVVRSLVEEGLSPGIFKVVGFADTKPLNDNKTDVERQANRRVNIVLVITQR